MQYVWDLYDENYKILATAFLKRCNTCRGIPYLWIGRLIMEKIPILPKLICRFNVIPIKISTSFFIDIDKLILIFMWEGKEAKRAKKILKRIK